LPFDFAVSIQYSGGAHSATVSEERFFSINPHHCFPGNSLRNQVKWLQWMQKFDTVLSL